MNPTSDAEILNQLTVKAYLIISVRDLCCWNACTSSNY